LIPLLSATDIALDVGAHAGAWAYPLSRRMSYVYAFEALPYYAQVLTAALKTAGARNVTVVNNAVSNLAEDVSMVWREPSGARLTGLTHVASQGEGAQDTVSVRAVRLDDFVKEQGIASMRIGLIKCDVEGYEFKVIEGACDTICKWRPIVFAEVQDSTLCRYGKKSADLIQLMTAFGYGATAFLRDGSTKPVDASTYPGEGDILFCPK
jgi:FkbM family methyltransferase